MKYKGSVVRTLILIAAVFGFVLPSVGQGIKSYQIFKLENKIGQELVSSPEKAQSLQVTIRAQDRGVKTLLTTSLTRNGTKYHFTSTGQTSRFKSESIDTLVKASDGFPLSESGSIKMREWLVKLWHEQGRPNSIRSTLTHTPIIIEKLDYENGLLKQMRLNAYRIKHQLDEVLWADSLGNAVFLITTDSESDRRAVIADDYLPHFDLLNSQSTKHLLDFYRASADRFAVKYPVIAIIGGTVVDVAADGALQENSMVIITHKKITYVGPVAKSLVPADAKVIDATDKFLIPGLWDMHVHLFHPSYFEKSLLSGVTAVRDMGNEFDLMGQLRTLAMDGSVATPELYAAGLMDGNAPTSIGGMRAGNNTEIRTNLQRYHDAGFNQIKIYSNVRKKQFNAIVSEAKRLDMQVVGHLPVGYTFSHFLKNGMNSLSHIHYFVNNVKWLTGNFTEDNKDLLDEMLTRGIYLDPTLNIYRLTGDTKISTYGRLLKMFADYGIPIVAGTDNEGTIADELQSYVDFGMSPLEALKSATMVPARLMNSKSGSIEKGYDGNILILEVNPLSDIKALTNVGTVIRGQFIISKNDKSTL